MSWHKLVLTSLMILMLAACSGGGGGSGADSGQGSASDQDDPHLHDEYILLERNAAAEIIDFHWLTRKEQTLFRYGVPVGFFKTMLNFSLEKHKMPGDLLETWTQHYTVDPETMQGTWTSEGHGDGICQLYVISHETRNAAWQLVKQFGSVSLGELFVMVDTGPEILAAYEGCGDYGEPDGWVIGRLQFHDDAGMTASMENAATRVDLAGWEYPFYAEGIFTNTGKDGSVALTGTYRLFKMSASAYKLDDFRLYRHDGGVNGRITLKDGRGYAPLPFAFDRVRIDDLDFHYLDRQHWIAPVLTENGWRVDNVILVRASSDDLDGNAANHRLSVHINGGPPWQGSYVLNGDTAVAVADLPHDPDFLWSGDDVIIRLPLHDFNDQVIELLEDGCVIGRFQAAGFVQEYTITGRMLGQLAQRDKTPEGFRVCYRIGGHIVAQSRDVPLQ